MVDYQKRVNEIVEIMFRNGEIEIYDALSNLAYLDVSVNTENIVGLLVDALTMVAPNRIENRVWETMTRDFGKDWLGEEIDVFAAVYNALTVETPGQRFIREVVEHATEYDYRPGKMR